MAIGGGGSGGGPIGITNSFTGPAEALETYGDFAAAYTGLHTASTTTATVLSFTSGSYLFVGNFQLNGAVDPADGSLQQTTANIKFNGVSVAVITSGNGAIDAPMSVDQPLVIPPYTEISVEFDSDGTSASRVASGTLIGRIYR